MKFHTTNILQAIQVLTFLGSHTISGHGVLRPSKTDDKNTLFAYKPNIDITGFAGTIDGQDFCPNKLLNTDPVINVQHFIECFTSSKKYKNINEMITDRVKLLPGATIQTGFALLDGPGVKLNNTLYWSQQFLDSHRGPCMTLCDDIVVQEVTECVGAYRQKPGEVNINCKLCANAKVLRFLYIAMHGPTWQVYISGGHISGLGSCKEIGDYIIEDIGPLKGVAPPPKWSEIVPQVTSKPTEPVSTTTPVAPAPVIPPPPVAPAPVIPPPPVALAPVTPPPQTSPLQTPLSAYSTEPLPESTDEYSNPPITETPPPTNPHEAPKCAMRR